MTSYVTQEEYERLTGRLDALERKGVTVNVNVSADDVKEEIAALVRQGIKRGLREHETRIDRYPPPPRR